MPSGAVSPACTPFAVYWSAVRRATSEDQPATPPPPSIRQRARSWAAIAFYAVTGLGPVLLLGGYGAVRTVGLCLTIAFGLALLLSPLVSALRQRRSGQSKP
jgi:hypothetical protein